MSWGFHLGLRALLGTAIDLLACLVTIKVNIALGISLCFSSTLAMWPLSIAALLTFSWLVAQSATRARARTSSSVAGNEFISSLFHSIDNLLSSARAALWILRFFNLF